VSSEGYRKRVGRIGEEEAAKFLKNKGFQILERNFRAVRGEIDIIARDKKTLVFIEVKTGVTHGFGEPEERVNQKKQRQIGKVAMKYLQRYGKHDIDCRFDVVSVVFLKGEWKINHIEDAFWL